MHECQNFMTNHRAVVSVSSNKQTSPSLVPCPQHDLKTLSLLLWWQVFVRALTLGSASALLCIYLHMSVRVSMKDRQWCWWDWGDKSVEPALENVFYADRVFTQQAYLIFHCRPNMTWCTIIKVLILLGFETLSMRNTLKYASVIIFTFQLHFNRNYFLK